MKIILSRKGFDSGYGGYPSPIIETNGTKEMLSLPIPFEDDNRNFKELCYKEQNYFKLIQDLSNGKFKKEKCHLDPDIRKEAIDRKDDWRGLFGQSDSAYGHLRNQNINENDVFLFFGWFREASYVGGKLQYKKGAADLQVIFGYLQVGKLYVSPSIDNLPDYAKTHPHAVYKNKNNAIYEAKKLFTEKDEIPGYGPLKFNENLILTQDGQTRSRWKKSLPFVTQESNIAISYHSKKAIKEDYFQSARIGQEFVVKKDAEGKVENWAIDLIKDYHIKN